MRITKEWIMANRTPRGSWKRDQLACIGVSWPPRAGWVERLEGIEIDDLSVKRFEAMGRNGKPVKSLSSFPAAEMGDTGIEIKVASATSCPAFIPFTAIPKKWAGKTVRLVIGDFLPEDKIESDLQDELPW